MCLSTLALKLLTDGASTAFRGELFQTVEMRFVRKLKISRSIFWLCGRLLWSILGSLANLMPSYPFLVLKYWIRSPRMRRSLIVVRFNIPPFCRRSLDFLCLLDALLLLLKCLQFF